MKINHLSPTGPAIRNRCTRMHLAADSPDEAAFLAALLRAMVSGGEMTVRPSWGGSVAIEFPASDGAGRAIATEAPPTHAPGRSGGVGEVERG